MKPNHVMRPLTVLGRWLATALFGVAAVALIWQGSFFADTTAMAAVHVPVLAADLGSQAQGKASEDAGRTKNFIRDTANKVEETAQKNAQRVEDATDGDGGFIERKAKRDAARIQKRAEEDAARTQDAVDATKNAFERTVDNIKDAFGS